MLLQGEPIAVFLRFDLQYAVCFVTWRVLLNEDRVYPIMQAGSHSDRYIRHRALIGKGQANPMSPENAYSGICMRNKRSTLMRLFGTRMSLQARPVTLIGRETPREY